MKAYILESSARIGDVVFYQQSEERRHHVGPSLPDGTRGVVIGWKRNQQYIGRDEAVYAKNDFSVPSEGIPGLYEQNGAVIVDWEIPCTDIVSAHEIYLVDQSIREERDKNFDKAWHDAFSRKIRIGDLPDLPYYEEDIVQTNTQIFNDNTERLVQIRRIYYNRIGEYCTDGVTPIAFYDVTPVGHSGPSICIDGARVRTEGRYIEKLVSRGLYWHWHNDRENIKFSSIKEEAAFYHSIGLAVQVRNPVKGDYGFTTREAIAAIRDKIGSSLNVSAGFFGAPARPHVYSFPSLPEFEERLRASFNFKEWEEAIAAGKFKDEEETQ